MSTTKEITKNLGGNRLGSGNKNNIDLHAYNRSTHDLTRVWRSSMNVGTLVPFIVELGLNGDSFTVNLDNITRTIPSIGPLYGSYKLQIDIFECPIRLYNGLLHNNMTNIGLNMAQVKFPKITLQTIVKDRTIYNEDLNKSQISKSSLINYLGLNGIGDVDFSHLLQDQIKIERKFNAVPLIAYWDIYKNYYANKQEEKGAYICANPEIVNNTAQEIILKNTYSYRIRRLTETTDLPFQAGANKVYMEIEPSDEHGMTLSDVEKIKINKWKSATNKNQLYLVVWNTSTLTWQSIQATTMGTVTTENNGDIEIALNSTYAYSNYRAKYIRVNKEEVQVNAGLSVKTFDLSDIDDMRIEILKQTGLNRELSVNDIDKDLWNDMTGHDNNDYTYFRYPQHGLALKTYQSDLYNNWLQTEWIDGQNGINKITAIDTSSGSFEIDALILSKKIYNMLNRIAVSGGSFEDWQEAVYSVKAIRRAETPVYKGGMSAEIMFSEVVSQSATEDQPLGSLAGKGGEHGKKGGQIEISCEEPAIIIGIVSITPRIDYSQGNSWILTELDNMDDIHKPALDGIGFQDLLQERMAYWGTIRGQNGEFHKLAAGKVPAWIHYMTAVNETHGDFAEEDKCMFMTLNRRYEFKNDGRLGIADLTTYIDPRKYNYIFTDASLESQNFWLQIGIGITARRVMSAKIIPFL